jgi:hypothetical protein
VNGLGSGALVDFSQGEEFQLTPSGGIEADEDSGSQVIELEDSSEFGGMPGEFGGGGFDPVQEGGGFDGFGGEEAAGMAAAAGFRAIPETPYTTVDVMLLLGILLLMCLGGVLMTDLARNMWAWDGQNNMATGLTNALVSILPK